MAELFRDFLWVLFPIGFMALCALRAWFDHRARLETIRALRELADKGLSPPAALASELSR